jgi:superfamily I DNA and/or RNA helicase
MTTTGAAIHQQLLMALEPAVVVVEEACEVLEAQLLASLTPSVKHLIMIGDYKQLRPKVS